MEGKVRYRFIAFGSTENIMCWKMIECPKNGKIWTQEQVVVHKKYIFGH
jgi:hypothetical protein